MKPDFSKGMIPAIIVDDHTEEVLMLAYMDEEAYKRTLTTETTWFYSRSRNELWNKGATSGNLQDVQSIQLDCDGDTFLIRVIPRGPACHTGERTCFFHERKEDEFVQVSTERAVPEQPIFDEVMQEVEDRKKTKVENSYTNYLFDKGIDKIGKKVIEEAGEVVIAAKNQDKTEVINEVSDLFYHSFVLLAEQGIPLEGVKKEMENRFSKKGNSKGDRPEINNW